MGSSFLSCLCKYKYNECTCDINSKLKWASLVAQSCPTLCDPMDYSTPGFPVLLISQSLPKLMSIDLVMPSIRHILRCLLLLWPSIFPSIRVFSFELALCIRWPKYWSFSFSTSPSIEYSGLIFFKIDWFDLLAEKCLCEIQLGSIAFSLVFWGVRAKTKSGHYIHSQLLEWFCFLFFSTNKGKKYM